MKHINKFLLSAIIGVLLTASGFQTSPEYKILFEKAKFTMETKGDLDGAINLFKDIIKKFPKEIQYAANSQLYIGLCYEKLGKQEAQKAFEAVIANYPTQVDAVRTAKEKLNRLSQVRSPVQQSTPGSTIRSIWSWNDLSVTGSISPDQRYFSLTDWVTGDLAIREIATGKQRRLTNKGVWDEGHPEYALTSRWSPDSRRVAYIWVNAHNESELHEIGLTDTVPRVICGEKKGVWTEPIDWSLKGNFLLAKASIKNGPVELQMISVADGSIRVLKTFSDPNSPPGDAFISPDGLSMAYSRASQTDIRRHDIFLLRISDGSETLLVQHPAHDKLLGWLPDEHGILFASDRTGSTDAWMVPVKYGEPQVSPTLVRRNIGTIQPMGLTRDGKFFFATPGAIRNIYTVTVDPQTGRVLSPPVKESLPFEGNNLAPAWSPDGKTLAYVSLRELAKRESVLCLYSSGTKEIRELHLNKMFAHPSWTPDGRHLLVQASVQDGQGIYQVNIQSEEVKEFLKAGDEKYLYDAQMTPDGKEVIYGQEDGKEKTFRFLVRDIATGQEKEVARTSFTNSTVALSPDGKRLVMILRPEENLRVLQVMDFPEGSPKEILRFRFEGDHYINLAWSPDNRFIYFSQMPDKSSDWDLWRIHGDGGEAQNLGIKMRRFESLSIHPDGHQITFASLPQEGEFPQIWVMENFLPKEKIEASNQLTMKKLDHTQLNVPFARLSPDGKKMAYVVYIGNSPKSIEIFDLKTRTTKVLIDSGASGESSLVWSPGSDKIAYTRNFKELKVCGIDGTNSHVLIKNSVDMIFPTDWSRDGKKILCFFEADDRTLRIGTVNSDGQINFLASGNSADFSSEPKISPDGKYVVCSLGEKGGNTDIYVWTSDGSHKVRLTEYPGRDENPVWSPDGKYIAFLSDRNRSVDLWGVQMKDGATAGAPFVIKRDLGWRARITDLTASGELSLLMVGGAEPANLFTVEVDQESISFSDRIAPISVYPTDHTFPKYSPNGKMISYLSRKGQIGFPKLFLLNEKGAERELPLQGHFALNVAWHPDNQSLFFAGMDKIFKAGIYEVFLDKDEIRTVYSGAMVDMKTYKDALININLLTDAGKLMFFRWLEKGDVEVLTCQTDGQQPSVVLSRVKMPVWGLPSPNGENICYRTGDSLMLISGSNGVSRLIGSSTPDLEATWSLHGESLLFREGSRLKIFSVKENKSRTLYETPSGKTIGGMEMYGTALSPDGNRIMFTERDTSASSTSSQKLFMINSDDGLLKIIGEAPSGYRLSELRWSPDGSKVVATGRSISSASAPYYEYWIIENFLPK